MFPVGGILPTVVTLRNTPNFEYGKIAPSVRNTASGVFGTGVDDGVCDGVGVDVGDADPAPAPLEQLVTVGPDEVSVESAHPAGIGNLDAGVPAHVVLPENIHCSGLPAVHANEYE